MKKLFVLVVMAVLIACNSNKKDEPESEMKFAATLPSGQRYEILANGDSLFFIEKDTSESYIYQRPADTFYNVRIIKDTMIKATTFIDDVGYYTYKKVRTEIRPKKGGTIPPTDTVVVPPPPPPPTGQTYTLAFTQIPFSAADLNRPGAGAEQWHDRNDVNLGYTPQDVYWRFVATRIATATRGVYNWAFFDNLFEQAKARGQKVSFGIMTVYPDGDPSVGLISIPAGGYASYPLWLHNSMMNKSVKAWRTGNTWTPNYNDTTYTNWLLELHKAINDHIYAKGYDKMINAIDIRGYGAWGEWHSGYTVNNVVTDYPAGTFPTTAALKRIVDAHIQGFPNFQLQCMIAAFDAGYFNNTKNPPEIAHYVLTQRNAYGLIGWRRDQWGATDQYLKDYLENNTRSFNGLVFKDSIMVRYKSAPITGEPPAWNPNEYGDLERQIRLYGATSFGNGNYGGLGGQSVARVIAASKAAGYRLSITAGTIQTGSNTTVSLTWNNSGICPTYENWNVVFDVTDNSGVVKSFASAFKPRLFLPGTKTVTDILPITFVKQITVKVVDAKGYRSPMPLFIQGRNSNGSYTLKTF